MIYRWLSLTSFLLLFLLLPLCNPAFAQSQATQATSSTTEFFRTLAETRRFTLGTPIATTLTPDESSVLFLRGKARSPALGLYEFSLASNQLQELVTPDDLLKGSLEVLSPEEKARRERMRMTLKGITSYSLSKDGSHILAGLAGNLYLVQRSSKKVTPLPEVPGGWIDPHFSPDGAFLAAVHQHELYVIDLSSMTPRALTQGATESLWHGEAEFVAQEEMDRFSGFWWSPDSRALVYQETDLSEVDTRYVFNPATPEEAPTPFAYPRAGRPNAKIKLFLATLDGQNHRPIPWDHDRYPYLAAVVWQMGAPLTLVVATRNQQELCLLEVDGKTLETRPLLTETDTAWVNLPGENLETPMPFWLPDGKSFIWRTERRGFWQLELRRRDGTLLRELTPVSLNIDTLVDVDPGRNLAVADGGPDPRERHLYRIPLGRGRLERYDLPPGLHSATFGPKHEIWLHESHLADGSQGSEVRARDGRLLASLPSVAEVPPFVPQVEFLRLEGQRTYDAAIIRPQKLEPGKRYPVILDVYGGPGHKQVIASPLRYLEEQWLADQGFVVVTLDGRGTPGHGRDWERSIRGNLIDVVLEDQIDGLNALGRQAKELDLERVGVIGWSFGGYVAAMATIRRPDVFKAGVAGAPVTLWEEYDTCYTERYLDLPQVNPEGYRVSSVLTYASQLSRPLLLIHGMTDDNVYAVHTLRLSEALYQAARDVDLLLLNGTHLVRDPLEMTQLNMKTLTFFQRHLLP